MIMRLFIGTALLLVISCSRIDSLAPSNASGRASIARDDSILGQAAKSTFIVELTVGSIGDTRYNNDANDAPEFGMTYDDALLFAEYAPLEAAVDRAYKKSGDIDGIVSIYQDELALPLSKGRNPFMDSAVGDRGIAFIQTPDDDDYYLPTFFDPGNPESDWPYWMRDIRLRAIEHRNQQQRYHAVGVANWYRFDGDYAESRLDHRRVLISELVDEIRRSSNLPMVTTVP